MTEIPIHPNIGVCYALREKAGRTEVLLLKRVNPPAGIWCHIAGGIEEGETAWQCALRELKEETGLVPERYFASEILEMFYEHSRNQITMGAIFVAYINPNAEIKLNAEHSDFGWFEFEEAIERVEFAKHRSLLQQVERDFVKHAPSEFNRIEI